MKILIDTEQINNVLLYHCRIGPAKCRECGDQPLGSSFIEHQIEWITKYAEWTD